MRFVLDSLWTWRLKSNLVSGFDAMRKKLGTFKQFWEIEKLSPLYNNRKLYASPFAIIMRFSKICFDSWKLLMSEFLSNLKHFRRPWKSVQKSWSKMIWIIFLNFLEFSLNLLKLTSGWKFTRRFQVTRLNISVAESLEIDWHLRCNFISKRFTFHVSILLLTNRILTRKKRQVATLVGFNVNELAILYA